MASLLTNFARRFFGYDAVEDKGRRKAPRATTTSEDAVLPSNKRKKLVATTRDVMRNYALAGWMIRCHLDYVSRFNFQARTDDPALNKRLEQFIAGVSRPGRFDVSGRFSRDKAMRLSEARRILDGDIFWGKLSSGRIQIIEGDRVRNPAGGWPDGHNPADYVQGIRTQPGGKLASVVVCQRGRGGKGYCFERIIPARHVWQHACWDATYRVDQVRGISLMAPSLNTLQDIYEGIDLAMAKAKVAQMFGLIFYRNAVEESEGWNPDRSDTYDADNDGLDDTTGEEAADGDRYEVDPGAGPFKLELNDTDKAEFLSTNTPENELLEFLKFASDLSIKCLDIPYSFYDSSKVNYYGQKADIQKYENSARSKREDNQQLLDRWAAWRMKLAILNGSLTLPGSMTLDEVIWEWVPTGMPWIDKLRDMKADELALSLNLDSEIRIARRSGQDAHEIALERLDYEQWLAKERQKRQLPDLNAPTGTVPALIDTIGDDDA